MLLEPIWEADFNSFSNGFRPGRSTMDCIQPLYKLGGTRTGYSWVIDPDVRACSDKIENADTKLIRYTQGVLANIYLHRAINGTDNTIREFIEEVYHIKHLHASSGYLPPTEFEETDSSIKEYSL